MPLSWQSRARKAGVACVPASHSGAKTGGDPVLAWRVLLAPGRQILTTGGGAKYTLRQHVELYNEADVLVDATEPLIRAVLRWARTLPKPDPGRKQQLCFHTNNSGQ